MRHYLTFISVLINFSIFIQQPKHSSMRSLFPFLLILTFIYSCHLHSVINPESVATDDTLVMRDITWDSTGHAGSIELRIPSEGSLMQGLLYKANGLQHHPTLLVLHGFPGNEKNLDLAQAVRSHGWNAVFFNYRGSWGSQGTFTFKNCVQDVSNV